MYSFMSKSASSSVPTSLNINGGRATQNDKPTSSEAIALPYEMIHSPSRGGTSIHDVKMLRELKREVMSVTYAPGTQPDDVYDGSMAWWRASIRKLLIRSLKVESRWIAAIQVSFSIACISRFESENVNGHRISYATHGLTRTLCIPHR